MQLLYSKFPVKDEFRVDRRTGLDEWMITLVLPIGERLGGVPNSSPGIYAFYQTEMVTKFPFIIQAYFLLDQGKQFSLTRSGLGILDFIPAAFVNAFLFLGNHYSSRKSRFLPVNPSC
ncbi:hypothetical protein ACFX15_038011 [Malus domestica]